MPYKPIILLRQQNCDTSEISQFSIHLQYQSISGEGGYQNCLPGAHTLVCFNPWTEKKKKKMAATAVYKCPNSTGKPQTLQH